MPPQSKKSRFKPRRLGKNSNIDERSKKQGDEGDRRGTKGTGGGKLLQKFSPGPLFKNLCAVYFLGCYVQTTYYIKESKHEN